jgi:Putative zinc-finger
MTRSDAASQAGCAVLPADEVAAYARGRLGPAQEWSVEAHLPGCQACRRALAACTDGRLDLNRAVLLTRAGLSEPAVAGRILRRCGVPEHIAVLLAATPSLRRSWLTGVLAVLATVVGASQLAAFFSGPAAGPAGPSGWTALVPFLVITPLLPLAAVAAAFSPSLDPAYRLASAAPVSKVWLLCIRSAAVIAATLVPAALAALALPRSHWLAVALLLPALAICAVGLALATAMRAEVAAAAAAAGWTALAIGIAVTAAGPASVLGTGGQLTALAVLAAAAALIAARRNKIDYGWMG